MRQFIMTDEGWQVITSNLDILLITLIKSILGLEHFRDVSNRIKDDLPDDNDRRQPARWALEQSL